MDSNSTFNSLHGIRDNALLLSLGHKYLCGEPFLIKTGRSVDSHLEQLKEDIKTLKKKFPGKFLQEHEVDTDGIVRDLYMIAKGFQKPDKKIRKKCSIGELGRELEEGVDTMALAIDEIWDQVEGRGVTYSTRDSAANVIGAFKSLITSVLKTVKLIIKMVFLLLSVIALGLFALYMTMETEGKYLKQINKIDALILPQNEIIAKYDREIGEITRQVESIRERAKTRESVLKIMDLNVKINALRKTRQEAEVKINLHENDKREKEEKLEVLRKKPFMKRLFRRK